MNAEQLNGLVTLTPLLQVADAGDLDMLVDYITDNGDGRLSLANSVCSKLVAAKAVSQRGGGYPIESRALIAEEILAFGGNTLGNLVRSLRSSVPFGTTLDAILPDINEKVSYLEVVRDVASHLKVEVDKSASIVDLEVAVLVKILTRSFDKMSPEERRRVMDEISAGDVAWGPGLATATLLAARMTGAASLRLATTVAEASARALVGRSLTVVGVGGASRALGAVLGPIGWAVTGLWTLADLSAPAYRVTVPCVVQVAYIRQKLLMQMTHATCSCGAHVVRSAKFCPECGSAMKVSP
jgi:uncharacterized protein YaaW (UPF0174 family)